MALKHPLYMVALAVLLVGAAQLTCVPTSSAESTLEGSDMATYPLDGMSRTISPRGRMSCPKLEMTRHRGTHVRYHKPVFIYRGFQEKLEAFEAIVAEVAKDTYGRAPRRIAHLGTYNCRRIRRIPDLLSEHALGNAIDVEGFDFGPASGKVERMDAPHRRLRRGFKVRVDSHWDATRGVNALHATFLRALTERLLKEDVFRVMLGPAYPGHQDHFHFDLAPYRLIAL